MTLIEQESFYRLLSHRHFETERIKYSKKILQTLIKQDCLHRLQLMQTMKKHDIDRTRKYLQTVVKSRLKHPMIDNAAF